MRPVIVVDVILDGGKIGRHVFDLVRSSDAHAVAKKLADDAQAPVVSLRLAHINDDGYIIEGFKEG